MKHEVELRVPYADTDQMGFVHHSNYVKYLENARWEAFRKLGLTYKKIEDNGILMPVIDVNMRFIKPIYYDDLVRIDVVFNLVSPTKLMVNYNIINEANEIIHKASTMLTFLRKYSNKPCRVPEFVEGIFVNEPVLHETFMAKDFGTQGDDYLRAIGELG